MGGGISSRVINKHYQEYINAPPPATALHLPYYVSLIFSPPLISIKSCLISFCPLLSPLVPFFPSFIQPLLSFQLRVFNFLPHYMSGITCSQYTTLFEFVVWIYIAGPAKLILLLSLP